MRFLADESCDFSVVRALRAANHDVVAVAEISPRADDETVMGLDGAEGRILLTEDKDFGQIVHVGGGAGGGVILLRFPAAARQQLAPTVVRLVMERGPSLAGLFGVVQPNRIRIT